MRQQDQRKGSVNGMRSPIMSELFKNGTVNSVLLTERFFDLKI
jgi:hypothetical protein